MKAWRVALVLATSPSASCAPIQTFTPAEFATRVKGTGTVNLTGWLRLRGEVMLFVSPEAMQSKLRYPDCISGVFKDHASRKLPEFDGKKVIISGQLFKYDSLGDEDAPLLQRKVLAGSVIPNFCFGENVLLISEIKKAR